MCFNTRVTYHRSVQERCYCYCCPDFCGSLVSCVFLIQFARLEIDSCIIMSFVLNNKRKYLLLGKVEYLYVDENCAGIIVNGGS